jgi:DNA-binding MarR family transcriptional regulator
MRSERPSRSPDAYAIARRLHQVTEQTRRTFTAIASERGLTTPQARTVLRLFEPTSMGDLAEHLGCDASNVTGIAFRLTQRGIVTTTPGADRRVKLLTLTALGRRTRSALEHDIAEASPAMTQLDRTQRQTLVRLLDKMLTSSD